MHLGNYRLGYALFANIHLRDACYYVDVVVLLNMRLVLPNSQLLVIGIAHHAQKLLVKGAALMISQRM